MVFQKQLYYLDLENCTEIFMQVFPQPMQRQQTLALYVLVCGLESAFWGLHCHPCPSLSHVGPFNSMLSNFFKICVVSFCN